MFPAWLRRWYGITFGPTRVPRQQPRRRRPQLEILEERTLLSLSFIPAPGSPFFTNAGPASVAVADLTGNGKPDLVVADASTNIVDVLLGKGDGTFQLQPQHTFATGREPVSVAVADVNGDHKPDLIVANEVSNSVSVLLGNGDGTFQPQQTFAVGPGPLSVAVADVNGDGKLDLVTANGGDASQAGNSVSVLLGNGDGTFQNQRTFATLTAPVSVAVADVNGDGKLDLVTADVGSIVSVLLGNGDGTFEDQHDFAIGAEPSSMAVADLTGDGKPDIVTTSRTQNTVSVLLGNGDGTFQNQRTFAVGSEPSSVAVADLTGDGKPDLVVANAGNDNVSVLQGNGDGTFQYQLTFATGFFPQSVAVAEVNGDGMPDLVTANGGNNVSVLLHTAAQLQVSGPPAGAAAGMSFPVTVTALDANGQVNPSYTGTVSLAAPGDPQFVPPPAHTFTPADAGRFTFPVTLKTAGSETLQASDGQLTGSTTVPVSPDVPAGVTATAGTPQTATVATAFATPLRAVVKDRFGNPEPAGVSVTFAAPGSGASGTFAGGGGAATASTDATGTATAPVFTANTIAGSYTVTAAVAGVSTPASFGLTNAAGAPAHLTAASGGGQQAAVETRFAQPLGADVTDTYGNPVPGAIVTFTAPSSGPGGSFFGTTVANVMTNAGGVATAPLLTANDQVGTYSVSATVSGLAGAVFFAATNTAGAPAAVAVAGGSGQSAPADTPFAGPLQALVTDAHGNPVSGVTVTFTAPSSGPTGSFGGSATAAASTDATGPATAPTLTAGTQPGTYTVTAVVSGTAPPLTTSFTLTNTAGAPAAVAVKTGSGQSAVVGAPFAAPLQALVTDGLGDPVPGVAVTFTAPSSGPGGSFSGSAAATATTGADGVATAPQLTANDTAGGFSVTASVSGVAGAASFALTNTPGAPAAVAVAGGSGQSAAAGSPFASPLQALVTDAHGNPVPGVTVTFTAPSSGPTGSFAGSATATASTDVGGIATAPALTAGAQAGAYTVTATVPGLATAAAFSLSNTAGAAAAVAVAGGQGQSATVGTPFARPFQALVTDAHGNPVPGVIVTFTAPTSGPGGSFGGFATATASTDAGGIAVAPVFTAGTAAGTYTVRATVAGVATPAVFTALTNAPGPAAQLLVTRPPGDTPAGRPLAPPVSALVLDSFGNPVSGVPVTVTAGGPGGFSAGSDTTAPTVGGVATFADLVLGAPGTYTLAFTAAGLGPVVSAPFHVTAPAVLAVLINGGAAHRARVTSLRVLISEPVEVLAGAFQLRRRGGPRIRLRVQPRQEGGQTVVVLTFGAGKAGRHALARGTYLLRIDGSRVRNALGQTLGGERAPYTFRA